MLNDRLSWAGSTAPEMFHRIDNLADHVVDGNAGELGPGRPVGEKLYASRRLCAVLSLVPYSVQRLEVLAA